MRLPADRRAWLETACRSAAFLVLAFLVFRTLVPASQADAVRQTTAALGDLSDLTQSNLASRIHFELKGVPTQLQRSWQGALQAAGSSISWSGALRPIAIAARPIAVPGGGYMVTSAAPKGSVVTFRDDISVIDSISAKSGFAAASVAVASGVVRAVVAGDSAGVVLRDSLSLRRVLLFGKAGWESKFVAAALEEAGWKVDAAITLSPGVSVNQGVASSIDTARFSAVVALDESAAPRAREISSFVRSGGGLVLGDAAARSDAFLQLRVGAGPPANPARTISADTVVRSSSAFARLRITTDAISLERRGRDVVVAARRVDFGRVIQVAYVDTWRWRMQGNSGSLADHRDWWSGIVSQVAHTHRVGPPATRSDQAPYADLVRIAGAPSARPSAAQPFSGGPGELFWMLALCALLLAEWTSRRLRGVR